MPTKLQLEQTIASLRKQKGGIKADRTIIKAEFAKVKKRLANSDKRVRGLRSEKTELTGGLRKATSKVKRLEAKLTKFMTTNDELLIAQEYLEGKNIKLRDHGRKCLSEYEDLKKKYDELKMMSGIKT